MGKHSPYRARIALPERLPEGCPKKGLFRVFRRRSWSSAPSAGTLDESAVLTGMDSHGTYIPSARISRMESSPDQEDPAMSHWRLDPEFTGCHVCQGHAVEARDLRRYLCRTSSAYVNGLLASVSLLLAYTTRPVR